MDNTHKNTITKTASADLVRGTVVKLSTSDPSKIAAAAATDAAAIGVVLDDVKQGDNVAVALLGVANHTVEAVASGAISAGAKVCLGSGGKVSAFPDAGETAQDVVCVGITLTASYADGNIVELLHRPATVETVAAAG